MPAGRPSKYDPAFCDKIMEVAEYGGSVVEMAEACDVVQTTLESWADAHPEFLDALTRAKQKSRTWFEKAGRDGMYLGKQFNAQVWTRKMMSRYPNEYCERKQLDHTSSDKSMSPASITDADLAKIALGDK